MKPPANRGYLRLLRSCRVFRAARCFASRVTVAPFLALFFACGCSTFNRDWKSAAQQPVPINSIGGRWEGTWLSKAHEHSGKLRCLIGLGGENRCTAMFRATYVKLFHFTYTVTLTLQPHNRGWEFNGEENLGKLAGGVYYYEGHASPTNFFSTYRSKYDHGIFEMHRPE